MAFRWRANDGPLIVVFGSSLPHQIKNVKVGPPLTKLSGFAHEMKLALVTHGMILGVRFCKIVRVHAYVYVCMCARVCVFNGSIGKANRSNTKSVNH